MLRMAAMRMMKTTMMTTLPLLPPHALLQQSNIAHLHALSLKGRASSRSQNLAPISAKLSQAVVRRHPLLLALVLLER